MKAAGASEFTREHGILGYLHYLVFPLDLFMSGDEHFEASREQRVVELTPIMIWLIPLLLLLSNITYLNPLGLIVLFLAETIIMTFLTIIYCWRASLGFIFEIFVNYALSFFMLGILMFLLLYLASSCGIIAIIVIIIFAIAHFSRNSDYYNDDW
jgi:hypothetical protein